MEPALSFRVRKPFCKCVDVLGTGWWPRNPSVPCWAGPRAICLLGASGKDQDTDPGWETNNREFSLSHSARIKCDTILITRHHPAKHLTKGTENATQISRAWWQVMWRANKIAGWHEMQLGTKPSCQALLCSAVSLEWFVISAFCQGTALIGQGRVCSILSNRGQRKVANARLRRHVEVTLMKCKDFLAVEQQHVHCGFLLYCCKKLFILTPQPFVCWSPAMHRNQILPEFILMGSTHLSKQSQN